MRVNLHSTLAERLPCHCMRGCKQALLSSGSGPLICVFNHFGNQPPSTHSVLWLRLCGGGQSAIMPIHLKMSILQQEYLSVHHMQGTKNNMAAGMQFPTQMTTQPMPASLVRL